MSLNKLGVANGPFCGHQILRPLAKSMQASKDIIARHHSTCAVSAEQCHDSANMIRDC